MEKKTIASRKKKQDGAVFKILKGRRGVRNE
jgi:hypothetical protein